MHDENPHSVDDGGVCAPAIVLGTGLTALGVVRCLGRRGIPVCCITEDLDLESRSRWCRELYPKVGALADADALGRVLERLPIENGVLIPCSDHWTLEVTGLPERLRDRFPSAVPPRHVAGRFVDKKQFEELLREAAVPHPRSAPVSSTDEVERLVGEWGGRVFLKPSNSQRFQRRYGGKAIRVDSVEDAVSRFASARDEGFDFVLQEYIPGDPTRHHFIDGYVDATNTIVACFARQRLRMHPPDFGNSSFVVSIARDRVRPAVESLKTVFKVAKYRGIFSAEFKLDDRDGVFKLIEVNCRPWWLVEFAAVCGVDVVEMAYMDALGHRPRPRALDYDVGVTYVNPYYDYLAIKRLPVGERPGILEWLELAARSKQSIWTRDDPLPWFAGWWRLGTRWLGARLWGRPR